MKKMIAAGVLCLTMPLLLAACSASKAAESRQTEEVKAEISEETETQDTETAEAIESAGSPASSAPSETDQSDQSAAGEDKPGEQTPAVYFTSDISAEGLVKIYEALGWEPAGKTAVKISTGEPPASNYLRPELIGDLVKKVDGTIVECNTAYGGSRYLSLLLF